VVRALVLMLSGLLAGCGAAADSADDSSPVETVNWDNRTTSGFPRFVYPVEECGTEIAMKPPFEVSEDGFGSPGVRIPLAFLDDPSVREAVPGGPGDQSRISYAFPSRYRGIGMREWFDQGEPLSRLPIESLVPTLRSAASKRGPGGIGGDTYYEGPVRPGRDAAIWCTATDWPNPVCRGEVETGSAGTRYFVTFPPAAADRLGRILEIGDALFEDAVAKCAAAAAASAKKGPVPKDRP
jgi:hypothetical protein